MVRAEKSVDINRPLEQVFYVTAAKWPRNAPRWSPAIKELRQVSDGAFGVGTKLHQVREINGKPTPSTVEITEFQENHSLAFVSSGESMSSSGRYVFEPSGAGTRVTFSLDTEIGGLGRLATPMISRAINSELEADMSRLKEILESSAG